MKRFPMVLHHSGNRPIGYATVTQHDDGTLTIRANIHDREIAELLRNPPPPAADYDDDGEDDEDS